jgi:hypothetical protein
MNPQKVLPVNIDSKAIPNAPGRSTNIMVFDAKDVSRKTSGLICKNTSVGNICAHCLLLNTNRSVINKKKKSD